MKKLLTALSMILGFSVAATAQSLLAKPSEAPTAKPVTKEAIATEKKETNIPNALPVKEVKPVEEVVPTVATISPEIGIAPVKVVTIEKPIANVKTTKVVKIEKSAAVEAKPSKSKN